MISGTALLLGKQLAAPLEDWILPGKTGCFLGRLDSFRETGFTLERLDSF
jgi:hypothetical protein